MRKFLSLLLCVLPLCAMADKDMPKWANKCRKAVFSVITYDKDNKLLNTGNGFFVSEDGIALSDYGLFKGAQRAIIITADGKELEVKHIMGADDMYDVVKFRIEVGKKAPAFLTLAATAPAKGETVYLLPYSTQKEQACTAGAVTEASPLPGGHHYYTLGIPFNEKSISCPVMNASGEVFAMIQADGSGNAEESYAIGSRFAAALSISALSASTAALDAIGIKKALPPTEDEALVYLFMRSASATAGEYEALLDDFVGQFPQSSEGHIRRATFYIENKKDEPHFRMAENDLEAALELDEKKDNAYYNIAKLMYANQVSESPFPYKDWDLEKALETATEAYNLSPLPIYQQLRGDIYFAMQQYGQAYECYHEVNQSNLASPASYYGAAKSKELSGADRSEVIALLDSAINLYNRPYSPEVAPFLWERAQNKEAKGLYKEAVEDYNEYYQTVDGQVNDLFYYYREQANYKANLFEAALEDIQKALGMKPGDAVYLAEQGAVYLRISHYNEAIQSLKAALEIDPNFAACYRLIGFCQMQQGKKDEACENFSIAKDLGDEAVGNLIERNCR